MTQPDLLAGLEGQVYVVLRPRGSVEALFRETLRRLLGQFPGLPVTHPNSAHVTIRGYPKGADLATINRVVERWAGELPPLTLTVERITIFDGPVRAVILQIEKTPELRQTFTAIFDLSERAGLPYFKTAPRTADAWTFHVSTLYGQQLDDEAWGAIRGYVAQLAASPAAYTVSQAELVHYDGGTSTRGSCRSGDEALRSRRDFLRGPFNSPWRARHVGGSGRRSRC